MVSIDDEMKLASKDIPKVMPLFVNIRKGAPNRMAFYELVYKLIDDANKKVNIDKEIQCGRQECSFCCHDLILGSKEEVLAIAGYVKKNNIPVNTSANQTKDNWNNLSFKDRACPMLKDGKCSIYSHRPIVCRKHNVLKGTNPEMCNVDKQNINQDVILLPVTTMMMADMATGGDEMRVLNFEVLGNDSVVDRKITNGKFVK